MKPLDDDGLIDGKETRGFLCPICGEVIPDGDSVLRIQPATADREECEVETHRDCNFHTCEAMTVAAIEEHLMSLEFEVRREEGRDRDETAKSIDHYRRKLKRLKR